MHRRNPYRTIPDFQELAQAYPPLSGFLKGRSLDFQSEEAQRCLTKALLKRDFDLEIDIPPDRLCPPVPNRLNYILWTQDIVSAIKEALEATHGGGESVDVCGLDIGTGASAIYPLLACSLDKSWTFVGSEIDSKSFEYARRNVRCNSLEDRIRILHVGQNIVEGERPILAAKEDALRTTTPVTPGLSPVSTDDVIFDFDHLFSLAPSSSDTNTLSNVESIEVQFTLCNPPFYSSRSEVLDSAAAKEESAFGACTGAETEMITSGGEVKFVGAMVRESVRLRRKWETERVEKEWEGADAADHPTKRQKLNASDGKTELPGEQDEPRMTERKRNNTIRWYTSMLGKLTSVGEIVNEFRRLQITNYAVTEFVQGQTRRWGVCWSFDHFRLPDETARIPKPNPIISPLQPPRNELSTSLPDIPLSQLEWIGKIDAILTEINHLDVICNSSSGKIVVRATGDTWSRNARRKRARPHTSGVNPVTRTEWAMVCLLDIEEEGESKNGQEAKKKLLSRWIYGTERGLFESFVSHLGRRLAQVT